MDKVEPIYASAGSSVEYETIPAGVYLARCYRMVDIGTQTEVYANAKFAAKPTRKVILYWEILQDDEGEIFTMEDGRPFSVQKKYTLSINAKATLKKDLEAWRGKPFSKEEIEKFNIAGVVGAFCKLQIVHSENGENVYANVNAIMAASKKDVKDVEGVNDLGTFSVANPNQEMFDSFSEKLQQKINESDELKNSPLAAGERPQRDDQPTSRADKVEDVEFDEDEEEELANVGF